MIKILRNLLCFSFSVILFSSCLNTRQSTYFNDLKDQSFALKAEDTAAPVIQKNDILGITINSLNAEASKVFGLNSVPMTGISTNFGSSVVAPGFLVNSDGNIQLPLLGNIPVVGLSTMQVKESITKSILDKKLLVDPIVTVHQLNYEVTVMGEVTRPTVINVPNERISLLKALGMAGDITIFGRKDNVLLIREINGKRRVQRLDLNSADFVTSSYYYLQPNDIVYVEANKNKVATSSAIKQNLPIALSGLSIVLIALDRIIK